MNRWTDWPIGSRPKVPRLAVLAQRIMDLFPDLEAKIERGYCDTDHHDSNGRRVPGRGRHGNQLVVTHRTTRIVVYTHNAAETYRTNLDVVRWAGEEAERRIYGFPRPRWERMD